MQQIKCFIFDLDGTLVFNEQANFLAYQKAFTAVGLKLTDKDFAHHFAAGSSIDDVFAEFAESHSIEDQASVLAEIKKIKTKEYTNLFHTIEKNHATIGILQALSKHYHTALATTASKKNAQPLLDHFGLNDLFQYKIFGEDVAHKKPNPECHEKIAAHFGVKPNECLVFEDSSKGFAAAEAFGAHICKVVQ